MLYGLQNSVPPRRTAETTHPNLNMHPRVCTHTRARTHTHTHTVSEHHCSSPSSLDNLVGISPRLGADLSMAAVACKGWHRPAHSTNGPQLFPSPHSGTIWWQSVICHGGRIYPTINSNCYQLGPALSTKSPHPDSSPAAGRVGAHEHL
jgi:hypothetical protein